MHVYVYTYIYIIEQLSTVIKQSQVLISRVQQSGELWNGYLAQENLIL